MRLVIRILLVWPEVVARYLSWLAPLLARLIVGWLFLLSGWDKLHALPAVTHRIIAWGIPYPYVFAPLVSGLELLGGALLLAGLLTRISAGALAVVMIVAIRVARWSSVHSLGTLLSFDETQYLALFLWLAVAGAGPLSIDYWLQRGLETHSPDAPDVAPEPEEDGAEGHGEDEQHGTEAHGW